MATKADDSKIEVVFTVTPETDSFAPDPLPFSGSVEGGIIKIVPNERACKNR
jgi:hypothetical protein